jgi:hypothetical protein
MANGHYFDIPSRRRPIRAGEPRRISEPVVLPMESSRSGLVFAALLGIGASAILFGVLAARALSGEARLGPTPEVPSRVPAWTLNPEYEKALALPMASLPGEEESRGAMTSQNSTESAMDEPASNVSSRDSVPQGSGAVPRTSDLQRLEEERALDERRSVSGSDSQSRASDRLDAFGRDVGGDGRDLGIETPSGVAPERMEIERKERLDMAPTESVPGARPGSTLPDTDNPY